jgi:hypothetical protein
MLLAGLDTKLQPYQNIPLVKRGGMIISGPLAGISRFNLQPAIQVDLMLDLPACSRQQRARHIPVHQTHTKQGSAGTEVPNLNPNMVVSCAYSGAVQQWHATSMPYGTLSSAM